jgi:hypothetical protein
MIKTLGLIALVLVVGVFVAAAFRPDSFRVERRLRIQAPPATVYGLIQDLHQFNRWNPWLRKEPSAKGEYGGPAAGVGARYGWEGKELGQGSMEITALQPGEEVRLRLDFIKPFEAHNQAVFQIRPQPDGSSELSWAMEGPSPYLSKLMGLVFNMDRMIGNDFEQGLKNLQQLAEAH